MTKTGLHKIKSDPRTMSSWGKFGLVANQASVDENLTPSWKILSNIAGENLIALFGPQHGFEATVQDNMIETGHGKHLPTGLPVYSLYSETRRPSKTMLEGLDTLVIDLQITGCRVYTYKWTIAECMKACAAEDKKVVILDRPNPLGGEYIEGRVLEEDCFSFVGQEKIPMRHGLTPGELARFLNRKIECKLEVVELEDWDPCADFSKTGLPWVITSPNLPTFESVTFYPGTVLFESTNVSEGRGTSLPFQFIGSPYINDPREIEHYLSNWPEILSGVHIRCCSFMPTSQKWANTECNGIQLHVKDSYAVRSYKLGLAICNLFYLKDDFEWIGPGYEYNFDVDPVELIVGSKKTVEHFGDGFDPRDPFWQEGVLEYITMVESFLLYRREMRAL